MQILSNGGSVLGPTLRVRQGSEIEVRVRNDGDIETTVDSHGLRLDNRYDGVPHDTREPIPVGSELTYRLRSPDACVSRASRTPNAVTERRRRDPPAQIPSVRFW